jgi:hypothetical protein
MKENCLFKFFGQFFDSNKIWCFIIADFKRGILGVSPDGSKKAGGYYWTIDCFQNIGRSERWGKRGGSLKTS